MFQQDEELDKSEASLVPDWARDKNRGTAVDASNNHIFRDRNEEFWNT